MNYFFTLKPGKGIAHEYLVTELTGLLTNISKDCGYDEVDSVRVIETSGNTHIMSTKRPVEIAIAKTNTKYPVLVKMFVIPKDIENRDSFQNHVNKALYGEFLDKSCICNSILIGFSFRDDYNELTENIINDVIDAYIRVINDIPDISLTNLKVRSNSYRIHVFAFTKLNNPHWIDTEAFKDKLYLLIEKSLEYFSIKNKDTYFTSDIVHKCYLENGGDSISKDMEYIESISQPLKDIEDYTLFGR